MTLRTKILVILIVIMVAVYLFLSSDRWMSFTQDTSITIIAEPPLPLDTPAPIHAAKDNDVSFKDVVSVKDNVEKMRQAQAELAFAKIEDEIKDQNYAIQKFENQKYVHFGKYKVLKSSGMSKE